MKTAYRFSANSRHRHLDQEKALESVLYIAEHISNMYLILKAVFYADKFHLERNGRLMFDDSYSALDMGPVPSGTYDLIQFVRGDGDVEFDASVLTAFKLNGHDVVGRKSNREFISKSELKALDHGIALMSEWGFDRAQEESHKDPAYKLAYERKPNGEMPLAEIVSFLVNGEEIVAYHQD